MAQCNDPARPVIIPPKDPPRGGLPSGGTTGQVLTKASNEDGDVVWASGGGGSPVIVDTALSTTSTNPVQNRVITNALNDKASAADLSSLSSRVDTNASNIANLNTAIDGKQDKLTAGANITITGNVISATGTSIDVDDILNPASTNPVENRVITLSLNAATEDILANRTSIQNLQTSIARLEVSKQDKLTAGTGITIDANNVISASGGDKTFVAEYGVTTAQEIIEYIESTNEPFAPMLIKRGDTYYTVTTATKQNDTRVIIRSFATLSGDFYMFTYTVTNGSWSASSYPFQHKLTAGTGITISNNTISATGVSIDIDDALSDTSVNPVQNKVITSSIKALDVRVTSLADIQAALEQAVAKNTTSIGKLNTDMTHMQSCCTTVQEAVARNTSSIAALDVRIIPLENEMPNFRAAIARNTSSITALKTSIGDMSQLSTSAKTTIVEAINELKDEFVGLDDYAKIAYVDAQDAVLSNSIAALDVKVGDLNDLTTLNKTSIVGAINDLQEQIDDGECVTYTLDGSLSGDTLELSLSAGTSIQKLEISGFASQSSITVVQSSITTLQARLAALEAKLAEFEETRLRVTDGTTTVDKTILAKPYVAPAPPTPATMFDLADGAYDANGNYLGDFRWDDSGGDPTADIYGESAEFTYSIYDVYMNNILAKYPTVRGIVLKGESISRISGASSGMLDWAVLDMEHPYYGGSIGDPLFDNSVTDAVGTIYTKVTNGAPWGQTSATINTTGTPLAWA